jgi:hypothetical protein
MYRVRSSKCGKLAAYCAAVAAVLLTTVTNGIADGGTFTRGCAARDIQVMAMLEASNVSTQRMNNAMNTIMHARVMCFEGHVVDALALYNDIAQGITSDFVLSGRPDADVR